LLGFVSGGDSESYTSKWIVFAPPSPVRLPSVSRPSPVVSRCLPSRVGFGEFRAIAALVE